MYLNAEDNMTLKLSIFRKLNRELVYVNIIIYCRRTFLHEGHIYTKSAEFSKNSSLFTFPRQRTDESLDKNENKSFFILFFDYPKNMCCTFIKVERKV